MEEGKEVGPIEAEKGWGMGTVAKEEQTTERTPLVASTDVDVENGKGSSEILFWELSPMRVLLLMWLVREEEGEEVLGRKAG